MLRQRVFSAALFLPPLVGAVWAGEPWFTLLLAIVALLGAWEFYRLSLSDRFRLLTLLGLLGTLFFILNAHSTAPRTTYILLAGAIALPWPLALGERNRAFSAGAWALAGMFYLGWLLSHFVLLRGAEEGRGWVFFLLFTTFAVDTSAFSAGRAWGRHRLAPKLSPGKTWEGAVAGLAGGIGAAVLLAFLHGLPLARWEAALLGGLIGFFGQVGDLAESLLKRRVGAKDAGGLIPGHGGILDRLDSVLFALTAAYYYLLMRSLI